MTLSTAAPNSAVKRMVFLDERAHLQLPVAPEGLAMQAEAETARREAEARRLWEEDEAALRSLRMALREITTKLLCARQWKEFWDPVDPEDDPGYYAQVPHFLAPPLRRVSVSQNALGLGSTAD